MFLISGCENYKYSDFEKDTQSPEVVSVSPGNQMTEIAANSRAAVRFSEKIDPVSVTSQSFFVRKGGTSIAGSFLCQDSVITFIPSQNLENSTVYTVTLTSTIKDVSGNPILHDYSWSFTTAGPVDATSPSVISVLPLNNATGVAVNVTPTVNFSEALNPSTLAGSSFFIKRGTTSIPGNITLTGNTAKFTPSAPLAAGSLYTATVTTSIKDVAGNALEANFTWNFTTAAVTTGKSFSADVVPILNLCNGCHTHGWNTSSNASTFHANLLNEGYISTTSPTSGTIYKKVNGGHPSGSSISSSQKNTILTWVTEGSKNN